MHSVQLGGGFRIISSEVNFNCSVKNLINEP